MRLKNYHQPDDRELEVAFLEVYHFAQRLPLPGRVLVWLICKVMGDKLYRPIAQWMHSETMGTLHEVTFGMHADFFKRKRSERAEIERKSRDFVMSTIVE